jgi:flagellar hook-length control protein FliK
MPNQVASPCPAVVAAVREPSANAPSGSTPSDGNFAKVLQGQTVKNSAADSAAVQTPAAANSNADPATNASAAALPADVVAALLALLPPHAKPAIGDATLVGEAANTTKLSSDQTSASKGQVSAVDTAWLAPGQTVLVVAPATVKNALPTQGGEKSPATSAAISQWPGASPANLAAADLKLAANALAGDAKSNSPLTDKSGKTTTTDNFQAALAMASGRDAANTTAATTTAQAAAVLASNNAATIAAHAVGTPTNPHTQPVLTVATPFGSASWNADIGDKLTWMINRQEQRAELVLNPPQLGRIEVSLSLNGDQANAVFVSSNPAVRDALENAMPQLRELMAGAGINLGQTQVGAESAGQSAQQRESGDNSWRSADGDGLQNPQPIAGSVSSHWPGQGRGMVDVFA